MVIRKCTMLDLLSFTFPWTIYYETITWSSHHVMVVRLCYAGRGPSSVIQ